MSDYVPGPLTTSSEKLGGGWEIRNANYAYNVILALLLTLFLVTVGGAGGSVSKSYDADGPILESRSPITLQKI